METIIFPTPDEPSGTDVSVPPMVTINHRPGDDPARLYAGVAVLIKSASAGEARLAAVKLSYDERGVLAQTHYFTEPALRSSESKVEHEVVESDAIERPSPKPRRPRMRAASSRVPAKSARAAEPRTLKQGQEQASETSKLDRFIATLPTPNERTDLKGTRWSTVDLADWLPIEMSSGSRQTRSKALNPLIAAEVLTVGQLRNMRVSELLALPNMGEGSVTYLAQILAMHGLRFKPEPRKKD